MATPIRPPSSSARARYRPLDGNLLSLASKVPLPPELPSSWARAFGEDEFGLWQAFDVKGVRQRMRWIPPGRFNMGSPEHEAERGGDEAQHEVALTLGYWLADTACTQALWEVVLGENRSDFKRLPQNPVEMVSWQDIVERFLLALNGLVPGLQAQLPSEAQWEYACRAGTSTAFWFGDRIDTEQVNYEGNQPHAGAAKGKYRQKPVPVKSLPANGWGLYEMHGNVWEWCEDEYLEYARAPAVDPEARGGTHSRLRVLRGGGWDTNGRNCRSAYRHALEPKDRYPNIGFRLARSAC